MSFSHEEILETIPQHLRQFVVKQDHQKYTAQEHALWRHIMKRHVAHLSKAAHPVYLEGLKRTGITLDHVPSIEEMNACLSELGWRAVAVDGYIPTAAFMEFHCHRIMPIAQDMRTMEHVLYTPAPDIVHEAAGHAPFLVDIDYAEYLQKFGEYGMKAIFNKDDMELYEAIRKLSIIKEIPGADPQSIREAEDEFQKISQKLSQSSEASRLGRLYWWTVEYGLVGDVRDYKIFGAGLLSSLAESHSCLDDQKIKKIPYTVNAADQSFDITEVQPQLFVVKNCKHMRQVLEQFADEMCFRKGGASSLEQAIRANIVATCVYSSGLQVSGQFKVVRKNAVGQAVYLNTEGPTQLSYAYKELPGHGTDYHAPGFGSPVGRLQNTARPLEDLSVDELSAFGVRQGEVCELEFISGVTVRGHLKSILRRDGKNIVFTFLDCTVTSLEGDVLFQPEWGPFDMAVGEKIISVFAGSADREKYDTYPPKSSRPMYKKTFTAKQLELFKAYQKLRDARDAQKVQEQLLNDILTVCKNEPEDWLLPFEVHEQAKVHGYSDVLMASHDLLAAYAKQNPSLSDFIHEGLVL